MSQGPGRKQRLILQHLDKGLFEYRRPGFRLDVSGMTNSDAAGFRRAANELARQGRVHVRSVRVDGKAITMVFHGWLVAESLPSQDWREGKDGKMYRHPLTNLSEWTQQNKVRIRPPSDAPTDKKLAYLKQFSPRRRA